MKNKLAQILLVAILYVIPSGTYAWGTIGHRVVGEIAESYLTPKARLAVQKILGTESIAMASTWADFIRSDSAYKYLNSWHYIDFKEGLSESEFKAYLAADSATDAYTKLNFLIKQLKNKQLDAVKKKLYVRLLIHIVGDIHQPLHTGRPEDLGGNKIKLSWFNQPTNLHAVWDEKLIDNQQLSYTEYTKAINHTTPAEVSKWQHQPIADWLFESYTIVGKIYDEVSEPEKKLSFRYNFDHIDTVNSRLLKGGVRLAGILNQLFG